MRQCRGPWRGEVAATTTELALRVLQSPKLKADAERLEKASADLSKEAAKWRVEAACGNDAKRAQEAELGDPSTRREGNMEAADDNTRSEVSPRPAPNMDVGVADM